MKVHNIQQKEVFCFFNVLKYNPFLFSFVVSLTICPPANLLLTHHFLPPFPYFPEIHHKVLFMCD